MAQSAFFPGDEIKLKLQTFMTGQDHVGHLRLSDLSSCSAIALARCFGFMSITITCGLKSKALEPPRSEARDRRGTSAQQLDTSQRCFTALRSYADYRCNHLGGNLVAAFREGPKQCGWHLKSTSPYGA